MKAIKILLLILIIVTSVFASANAKRETRAVWLSTNYRLDWPPHTYDQNEQKEALERIFDNIKRKNLNTVYFQVRSNGMVMFDSEFEPFCNYFTGRMDDKPFYDPLKLAINLAKERGLELHAWVNVMRVFSTEDEVVKRHPKHVLSRHPEWAKQWREGNREQYWLDPGLPEVREYLIKVFTDLVTKYDIDGLQLDFARYPGKEFNDGNTYRLYGKGKPRDQWRRDNITALVTELYDTVKNIKPYVKLGATPIGIYEDLPDAQGWDAYTNVFQDSREWLRLGKLDYLAPQVYWPFKDNPNFGSLAKDWQKSANGRSVVIGLAAYKPEVLSEIERQIEFTRSIGADGVAFFRYGNIEHKRFASFEEKAFPAAMPWIDDVRPQAPLALHSEVADTNMSLIRLSWEGKRQKNLDYYSIYLLNDDGSETLFETVRADKTSVLLNISNPARVNYTFMLKSVDKLWNESEDASNKITIAIPQLRKLARSSEPFGNPILFRDDENGYRILVTSSKEDILEIQAGRNGGFYLIETNDILKGKNVIVVDRDLSGYEKLKLVYKSDKKEVVLNL